MVGVTLRGAARREMREYERSAVAARWIGLLSQIEPRRHPGVDKMLGKKKTAGRRMSGKEIGMAMRAWAARVN